MAELPPVPDTYKVVGGGLTPVEAGSSGAPSNFPSALGALGVGAPIPNTMVILGSSNGAGQGASTYTADPSAANGYASPSTSWAGLLTAALIGSGAGWKVINRSVSGSNSASAVARFYTDVSPYFPSHVLICVNPVNDGLDAIQHNLAILRLVKLTLGIGAIPILMGATPYNSYTAAQYQNMLGLNRELDKLGYNRVDQLSTLDNGSGGYVGGSTYNVDGLHSNDAGHAVKFNAIDLGIFKSAPGLRSLLATKGAWSPTLAAGIGIVAAAATGLNGNVKSWSMRMRIKGSTSGLTNSRAFMCAYSQGAPPTAPIRVRNANGPYDVADTTGAIGVPSTVNPMTDATPHDLVLTYNETSTLISFYIDGALVTSGNASVAGGAVDTFCIGSRAESTVASAALGYGFSDMGIWQSCLSAAAIADMFRTNNKPPASMIFDADLSASPSPIATAGFVSNNVRNGLLPSTGEAIWGNYAPF